MSACPPAFTHMIDERNVDTGRTSGERILGPSRQSARLLGGEKHHGRSFHRACLLGPHGVCLWRPVPLTNHRCPSWKKSMKSWSIGPWTAEVSAATKFGRDESCSIYSRISQPGLLTERQFPLGCSGWKSTSTVL